MIHFEVISRETLLDNQWVPVEKQLVRLPNGETAEWFITNSPDAAIIVPILKTGEILMQYNYKHGAGIVLTEFCAGMIDDGETPLEGAQRELLEETGFVADEWIALGNTFANPTGSPMRYHFFLATQAKLIQPSSLDPSEQVEVFVVKDIFQVEKILFDGKHQTSVASLALFALAKKFLAG